MLRRDAKHYENGADKYAPRNLNLVGLNSSGAYTNLLNGDPDGALDLYYAGTKALTTNDDGITIYDNGGQAQVFYHVGDQIVWKNNVSSGDVNIYGTNASALSKCLFKGDPDGACNLYYAGTSIFTSTSAGGTFGGARPVTVNGSAGLVRIQGQTGGWVIGYEFLGSSGTDLGGFGAYGNNDALTYLWIGKDYNDAGIYLLPDGKTEINYDGSPAFRSALQNSKYGLQMASNAYVLSGSGTPEAAVTAGIGSMYLRTDGGTGTTLYIKESGAGNTGWVAK